MICTFYMVAGFSQLYHIDNVHTKSLLGDVTAKKNRFNRVWSSRNTREIHWILQEKRLNCSLSSLSIVSNRHLHGRRRKILSHRSFRLRESVRATLVICKKNNGFSAACKLNIKFLKKHTIQIPAKRLWHFECQKKKNNCQKWIAKKKTTVANKQRVLVENTDSWDCLRFCR